MTTTELSTETVEGILRDCLFDEDETTEPRIEVEGILVRYGLHPDRVEGHREEIGALLDRLPAEFRSDGGGGWSFLNACMDRDGRQWTSFHQTMDRLFVLGQAIGRVEYVLPREMWGALPGAMPYLVIKPEATS